MSETVDYFKDWEEQMADIETPDLPDDNMEQYILKSIDPIVGAQMIQHYIETQSPDAQEELIRKYLDILNLHFMTNYMNCPTVVTIGGLYDMPDPNQGFDMRDVLVELEERGEARVGGKMYYFEKHFYTNEENGIRRPIVSLRMHGGAFKRDNNEDKVIRIDNYTTIPVTSISDYTIVDRT